MHLNLNKHNAAEEFENSGDFKSAYQLYLECLIDKNLDYGDILFKCGWCLENISDSEIALIVSYYLKAGAVSKKVDCRINSFFRAGWVLMQSGKNAEAIKSFKYSIQIGHTEANFGLIYQDSMYWCAVCLEAESRYLDAICLYRTVGEMSQQLNPESRYREIICLTKVGKYYEAIELSNSFTSPVPQGFSQARYDELLKLVEKERIMLKRCNEEILYEAD